ncbi:unnamed protein product [Sphagnum jensenii]|uniref:SHSP domain-containing protein n=1 Tax=Sphagnum jensenii TaxID=128206 RepID=A0ABP1B7A0_9BRYO
MALAPWKLQQVRRPTGLLNSCIFDPMQFDFDIIPSFFERFPRSTRDVLAVSHGTLVDWVETPEAHVIKADLPGLNKEEIKVEIHDSRTLRISGERNKEEVKESDTWHCVERTRSNFMRSFKLPEDANLEQIKAKVDNGVLTVTVPKIEKEHPKRPRTQSIEIGGPAAGQESVAAANGSSIPTNPTITSQAEFTTIATKDEKQE